MFGFHNTKQSGYEGNIQTLGGLMYYQYDGLGNVMDITNRLGQNVMSYRYDAFGNLFTQMAAPYNTYGYTGKTYDAKASLMDYGARWYSPSVGRFTSMDTYTGDLNNPLTQNPYIYVNDNPVNFTDPTGHSATGGTISISASATYVRIGTPVTISASTSYDVGSNRQLYIHEGAPWIARGGQGQNSVSKTVTENIPTTSLEFHASLLLEGKGGYVNSSSVYVTWYDPAQVLAAAAGQLPNGPTGTSGQMTVRMGSNGSSVVQLQELLDSLGANITVDGAFGPQTQAAVQLYQEANGLEADGIVGQLTRNALRISARVELASVTKSTLKVQQTTQAAPVHSTVTIRQKIGNFFGAAGSFIKSSAIAVTHGAGRAASTGLQMMANGLNQISYATQPLQLDSAFLGAGADAADNLSTMLKASLDAKFIRGAVDVSSIGKLSANELKSIGSPAENSGIRAVTGNSSDASKFFKNQVNPSTIREVKPGVYVGNDGEGITFTYRAASQSGPPTIDVNGVQGLRKIKFIN